MRSVLLDELPRPRIKEVHGRIGTALERGVGRDMPLDDLSEHYCQAERAEKCVCFFLLAGQGALAERRWQGAREHFQKVLDATEDGGFTEERIFSMEGIADADAALEGPRRPAAGTACCWISGHRPSSGKGPPEAAVSKPPSLRPARRASSKGCVTGGSSPSPWDNRDVRSTP